MEIKQNAKMCSSTLNNQFLKNNFYAQNPIKNTYSTETNYVSDEAKKALAEKNNLQADTFKGSNQTRGLKVVDNEIMNCKREDFDSDEAYTNHKKMLLDERRNYVTDDADAKVNKTKANTEGATKVLGAVGNFLGNAAEVAKVIIPLLAKK